MEELQVCEAKYCIFVSRPLPRRELTAMSVKVGRKILTELQHMCQGPLRMEYNIRSSV